ncbi:MAG: hypothetical protein HZB55_04085 [Deltaproteobacteria bacterium]|nr:hypothetical protein [Deltaproteobacteria bacterium]
MAALTTVEKGLGPKAPARMLGAVVLIGTILLFAGGPGPEASRSAGRLWDLGHVVLFFSAVQWVLRSSGRGRAMDPARRGALVLLAAVAFGAATELLQAAVGGDAEWGDLARDVLGAAAGLTFFSPAPFLPSRALRRSLRTLVLLLLAAASAPAAAALWDEASARRAFPVLSDLEGPFELSRWTGSARLSVSEGVSRSGRQSLRLDLGTEEYSGAFLRHFPGDWRGYRALRFRLYNPASAPLALTCRVHDEEHQQGDQASEDRFNTRIVAHRGWTDVEIPLAVVQAAPKGRFLDLGRIRGVRFFATRLEAPRTLYLDALRLER